MAVEASHLNLFPPQLITNRDFMKTTDGNTNLHNTTGQMGSGFPLTGKLPESLLPFYQYPVYDSVPAVKTSMNSDSGLTHNLPKKRSRDSMNQFNNFIVPHKNNLSQFQPCQSENFSFQIQQQQSEIDRMVAEHTKKIKLGLEEKQKERARLIVSAIGEGMMNKLKEKEEQIQRMGKGNWILQERLKTLYRENQVWRDLAQANEATANSLRSHLEQLLLQAHVSDEQAFGGCGTGGGGAASSVVDDAESYCDNTDYYGERMLAKGGGDHGTHEGVKNKEVVVGGGGASCVNKMCKICGERESSVLLLPCRHLCLCTICGSTLINTCPVCNSNMNASLHVNMS